MLGGTFSLVSSDEKRSMNFSGVGETGAVATPTKKSGVNKIAANKAVLL